MLRRPGTAHTARPAGAPPAAPSAQRAPHTARYITLALASAALGAFSGCNGSRAGDGVGAAGQPADNSTPRPPASAPAFAVPEFVAAPPAGEVDALVREALSRAAADKRRLVVYAGATWCEPCQRFHHAVERRELGASLQGVRFLEFDMDRDRERLIGAGYETKLIPLFALPAPDGRASGKQVEGGIKGEGAVGFILPRLEALLGP